MRTRRLQVTVSRPVMVALEILAQRHGVTISTQAMACLRDACKRTMESKDHADRMRAQNYLRSTAERLEDIGDDRFVERTYELVGGEDK